MYGSLISDDSTVYNFEDSKGQMSDQRGYYLTLRQDKGKAGVDVWHIASVTNESQ
jgi:hypothetical protein